MFTHNIEPSIFVNDHAPEINEPILHVAIAKHHCVSVDPRRNYQRFLRPRFRCRAGPEEDQKRCKQSHCINPQQRIQLNDSKMSAMGQKQTFSYPFATTCSIRPKIECFFASNISISTRSPCFRKLVAGLPAWIVSIMRCSAIQE